MPRNKVIYNSQAFYCSQVHSNESQDVPNTIKQLSRIQSFSEGFDINYLNINQFGNSRPIARLIAESPVINGGFSYYLTDGGNERLLGFNVDTNISGNIILPQSIYSLSSGDVIIESEIGKNFYTVNAGSQNWVVTAMSRDGKVQVAAVSSGPTKISYNYGQTWNIVGNSYNPWSDLTVSHDARVQAAADSFNGVWVSFNSGSSWSQSLNFGSIGVAMSSDGKYISATSSLNGIFVSDNSGQNWNVFGPPLPWNFICMSDDGRIQAATASQNRPHISIDYGQNWNPITGLGSSNWNGIDMSSDGKYITAVINGGSIWVSQDSGQNWLPKAFPSTWQRIKMSSNGKYQTATTNANILTSINYGQNWIAKIIPGFVFPFRAVDISDDGRYIIAVGNNSVWLSAAGLAPISRMGTSFINDILQKKNDEKNYYLSIVEDGSDNNLRQLNRLIQTGVIGLGNGYITSYTIEAGIGALPVVSVEVDGLNISVHNNISNAIKLPSINTLTDKPIDDKFFILPSPKTDLYSGQISVLNPGDITLNIPDSLGFLNTDLKIQNFSINLNLDRQRRQKIGRRYPISREINFPSFATIEINADVGDLSSGQLNQIFCSKPTYDFNIILNKPCQNSTAMIFSIKDARLISQNFASELNTNSNIDLTYEVQIDAPFTMNRGLFVSGTYNLNILNI